MKGLEKIVSYWALLGGCFLFAIMLVTSINVSAFALNKLLAINVSGLSGYEDFISLAISGAALMFFPYCQWCKGNVVVDLFVQQLPPLTKKILDKFWLLLLFLLALFFAYWMTVGMLESQKDNVLTPVLAWKIWHFFIPGILSLVLWSFVILYQIFAVEKDG